MALGWVPPALKAVSWVKLLKDAASIGREALQFYENSKKNEKQEAQLLKDMAIQLEALTKAIEVLGKMVWFALVLSMVAIVVAVISLILYF